MTPHGVQRAATQSNAVECIVPLRMSDANITGSVGHSVCQQRAFVPQQSAFPEIRCQRAPHDEKRWQQSETHNASANGVPATDHDRQMVHCMRENLPRDSVHAGPPSASASMQHDQCESQCSNVGGEKSCCCDIDGREWKC